MTSPESPSSLLERAADRLENLARVATPGPWVRHRNGNVVSSIEGMTFGLIVSKRIDLVDAEWITTLNPAVAAPLAALLRHHAGAVRWAATIGEVSRTSGVIDLALQILGEETP